MAPNRSGGEEVPYSERAEWSDVTPVPQDDGPHPLAVIKYPPGFTEVHDYFRAVQKAGEFSERALALTNDVIKQNSANYTAWYFRRRCLKDLGADLHKELEFSDTWARDCPKNYQVWYHRRWLISNIGDEIESSGKPAEEVKRELAELGERELEYHSDVMHVNEDYKNYNGWSHRNFISSRFGTWDSELRFVEELLLDDIRNNSAWSHRHTVIRNTAWPLTPEIRASEIEFTIGQLRKCANNESAWNYLSAYVGRGEGKEPWGKNAVIERFVQEVLAVATDPRDKCRFAVEALANILACRGLQGEAIEQYNWLIENDRIRARYWEWRKHSATTAAAGDKP